MRTSNSIRRAVRYALFVGAAAVPGFMVAGSALAQDAQDTSASGSIETVYVTGSAIRRVQGETALPVQVMDAAAIAKTGASSVVDLIQKLPAMQGGTLEAASVGANNFGFAGVSIHNVGENRTLVLLNGRRLAQFGGQTLTGFAAAMDLNAIPVASIERVEILTDGASALYGSDAVAGVVNFITKRKTTDGDISASYYSPKDGGRERGFSVSGGFGDYESDGYNLFVTASADKRDELNAVDRKFASSAIVDFSSGGERWRFFNGSPRNIPGNAAMPGDNPLISPYLLTNGTCPPNSAPVDLACFYDHVKFIQLMPERTRYTGNLSFDAKIGESQNFFVNALWSKTKSVSKIAQVPGEVAVPFGSPLFNQYLAPLTDPDGNPYFTGNAVVSYRAADLGQRINDDKADFYQAVAGIEGNLLSWDYNFALTQSESKVKGNISGYPGALAFNRLLTSGLINPFVGPGEQSEAGKAALASAAYKGYWDGGTSRLQTAEFRASRALFDLPNGNPVQFAWGLNYQKEKFQGKPSLFAQAALADPVTGELAPGGPGTGDQRFGDGSASIPYSADRKIFGAFLETVIAPTSWLELTGAVRYDDYNDVGNSTNYKGSFKITPVQQFMVRGSYGTGFHAPTVPQLKASPQSYGVTGNPYTCGPELLAIASGLGAVCRNPGTQFDVVAGGNADLKPEKSDQATIGFIYEPTPKFSFGADYWWIKIEDAFGQISETEAFANPGRYPGAWTSTLDVGTGTNYLAYNQTNLNTGNEEYAGIDFNVQSRWNLPVGTLHVGLMATYMLTNKLQLQADGEYYRNIGDYSSALDTVTFRWNGKLTAGLDIGNWSHSLMFNFKSGYRDVETTVDGIDANGEFDGRVGDVRLQVDDYYTFDWQSTWSPYDWLALTVGALNVFDKDPPLSLTTANFPIGYDSRYYDPRGRVLFGRVSVKF